MFALFGLNQKSEVIIGSAEVNP